MFQAPSIPVPLLDVTRDNRPLRDQLLEAVARIVDSGQFIGGSDCQRLEHSVAQLCGTEFAIGCASGSDALLLALMAIEIGPGDEVIVPSFTFFATASCVSRLGAKPVFVDVSLETYNLDCLAVEEAITPNTKAMIPVHLFGQCADMAPLLDLAQRYNLHVIEDCAQSIGATYQGQPAGSMGSIGCFSFYPTKNLGGFGDGGMITTNDAGLADRIRLLATHGMRPRYYHQAIGINSRLDTLQAALLNVKLPYLAEWTAQRQENARTYCEFFRQESLDGSLILPHVADDSGHVWNQFTVRIPGGQRDWVRQKLADAKIGTEVYYPVPLHRQACFADLGYEVGSLPVTERLATEVLSLPIFPGLTQREMLSVVGALRQIFASAGAAQKGAA